MCKTLYVSPGITAALAVVIGAGRRLLMRRKYLLSVNWRNPHTNSHQTCLHSLHAYSSFWAIRIYHVHKQAGNNTQWCKFMSKNLIFVREISRGGRGRTGVGGATKKCEISRTSWLRNLHHWVYALRHPASKGFARQEHELLEMCTTVNTKGKGPSNDE